MKTVLAVVGGLVLFGVAALATIGWLVSKGVISDPSQEAQATASAPSDKPKRTPASGEVLLGKGDDPLGEGHVGCTYYYKNVSLMTVNDDQGVRVFWGRLRVWLKAYCPSGATIPPSSGKWAVRDGKNVWDVGGLPFDVREARIWVNCNNQRVWAEFRRYAANGKTVSEYPAPSDVEGPSLENSQPGTIIESDSVLAPFTEKYCPAVENGRPAK